MVYFSFFTFVTIVVAGVVALMWALHVYPTAPPIRVFLENKEIAGVVIATGMALIAAAAAFMSVQLQIGVQRRATQISEITFWQQQKNDADLISSGLRIIENTIAQVKAAHDARSGPEPYIDATLKLQATGALDMSNWPPTGTDLISWDVNMRMASLRIWHNRVFNSTDATLRANAEREMKDAYDVLLALAPRVVAGRAKYEAVRKTADTMLAAIKLNEGQ